MFYFPNHVHLFLTSFLLCILKSCFLLFREKTCSVFLLIIVSFVFLDSLVVLLFLIAFLPGTENCQDVPESATCVFIPFLSRRQPIWMTTSRRPSGRGSPDFYITSLCRFLLHGQEEWRMYWLWGTESSHQEIPLAPAFGASHTGVIAWSMYIYEAEPEEYVQPHPYPGKGGMENCFLHDHLALWVMSQAIRASQYPCCAPVIHQWGTLWHAPWVLSSLHWWYLDVL